MPAKVTDIHAAGKDVILSIFGNSILPVNGTALICALLQARSMIPVDDEHEDDDVQYDDGEMLCGTGSIARKKRQAEYLRGIFGSTVSTACEVTVHMPMHVNDQPRLPLFGMPRSLIQLRQAILHYLSMLGIFTVKVANKMFTVYKAFYIGSRLDFLCFDATSCDFTGVLFPLYLSRLAPGKGDVFKMAHILVGSTRSILKQFTLDDVIGSRITILPTDICQLAKAFMKFQQSFVHGILDLLRRNNEIGGNCIPIVCPMALRQMLLTETLVQIPPMQCEPRIIQFFHTVNESTAARIIRKRRAISDELYASVLQKNNNVHRHAKLRKLC